MPTAKLGLRLLNVLGKYKERWNPDDLSELARRLREFAEALEAPDKGKKKGKG